MRRFFLLFIALIAGTVSAFAQVKHPFTFEDMMKLKRVGEPEVSPDGKWVIFSVVDVDLAANTKTQHIWIVPTAGGQEREIIADQDADRPRWAPDGKSFAFLSTKEGGSQVWVADFDGAAGTVTRKSKLTSIATEASGELWSPDGKSILFTSDVYPECDGAPAEESVCNAKRLEAAEKSKVKALIFDRLLYRHWNAYKEGKRTHLLLVQPCTWVVPPRVDSVAVGHSASDPASAMSEQPCLSAKAPLDLTPGDYDAPVFSLGGQDDYAFSPDGQEICYTSNHDKNPAASTNNDLWIVPVGGGPAKNITADNPASDSTPLYSPDGRYIAYRAQQRPGYESDRFRLMLYDRKTGERKNLTESFDRWVGSFVFAPDSKSLLFSAEDKGRAPIFNAAVADASYTAGPMRVAPGTILGFFGMYNDDLAMAPGSQQVVFTRMSIAAPSEIFRIDPTPYRCARDLESSEPEGKKGQEPWFDPSCGRENLCVQPDGGCRPALGQQITHVNDPLLSQISMSPLEPFWFTGAHSDKVQGFLVKPPNFDASKKYPVKFLIHGGPQGAWGDDWSYRWNSELFASPTSATPSGYVVIMINFHGSTGYGQKFIDAINGDWGGAPFEDLMKGLDYAEQTYPFIDKTRECALGASYGGYMINWILGHTDRFKCLVSHDGMFNAESAWGTTEELWFNDWEFKGTPYDNRASYEKWSPHQYAKNFKTPTLVIHGQRDYRLDVSEGLQLFTTLQMEGVPSKMLYFPDEGHWVLKPQNSQLWYKTVNDWVDRWTKK
jgi:dipeptidyl aminopeptidase/acylaminoacyl peptidase